MTTAIEAYPSRHVRPLKLQDQAADEIGRLIVAGRYTEGSILLEADLQSHGFSRSVVRSAMRSLVAKGLLEARPGIGTWVLPRDRWNMYDGDVLRWHDAGQSDGPNSSNVFELMRIIEPGAAKLAAERRSASHAIVLNGLAEELLKADAQSIAMRRELYHDMLYMVAANPFLHSARAPFRALATSTWLKRPLSEPMRSGYFDLATAVSTRNSTGAESAMALVVSMSIEEECLPPRH